MRPILLAVFCIPLVMLAQQTVAPTTGERVGPYGGLDSGGYNFVQSWEAGYRYSLPRGNQGKYRSDVNYGNGIRLLNSSLSINSKNGHGKFFDETVITTQGLGNDPYQSATLRIQKNQLYRYDLLWRSNDYFNPGLTVASGQHLFNTNHRWQDHELTLFPQGGFRIRAGYGRSVQDGPALTTDQEFDGRSDIYPVFRNVRQQFDDYRLGFDARLSGLRLTVQRRWEFFKEDTGDRVASTLNGTPPATLSSFTRSQPYRGQTPGWMGNLYGDFKWFTLNARATYAGTRGDFVQNEFASGTDRFGAAQNRQVAVSGSGNRPVTTGDLSITAAPASKFSLTNASSIANTRIVGNSRYTQVNNSTLAISFLTFDMLSIRLVTNSTQLRYRASPRFDAFAGFRYSDRLIDSNEMAASPGTPFFGTPASQSNRLRAGFAGVNWTPLKSLRAHLEAELGTNSTPFLPTDLRNYQSIRSRLRYRKQNLSLGAGYRQNNNNNSIVITAYSSRMRQFTSEVLYTKPSGLSLDGSYARLHVDTIGGIAFFAGAPRSSLVTGQQSVYISNIHSASLGLRVPLKSRADLYLGYSLTKDTGDGRSSVVAQPNATAQMLYNAQVFPLTYQSPMARVSVRVSEKLRWNAGYQYYGYHEDFGVSPGLLSFDQNYRANTGYTSILWSF